LVKVTGGQAIFTRRYDAFGNMEQGATAASHAFTGREGDPETGLPVGDFGGGSFRMRSTLSFRPRLMIPARSNLARTSLVVALPVVEDRFQPGHGRSAVGDEARFARS
jgi:hypothetical protein